MCYPSGMRTTLSLDDDVAAAVQRLREERHIGLSDAVNELIRAGLAAPARRTAFRQRMANLGLRVDVSSVADALEPADPGRRANETNRQPFRFHTPAHRRTASAAGRCPQAAVGAAHHSHSSRWPLWAMRAA